MTSTETLTYHFTKGLPGFEDLKDFNLQEHNEVFSLLSAADQPEVIFITVNPFDFVPDYEFELSSEVIEALEIQEREQVGVRCIVTWHSDRKKITVNLLAPVIFNNGKQLAKQIVLQNTSYTTKHPLWLDLSIPEQGGDV